MGCLPESRDRKVPPFVCSWCQSAPANGLGCGARTNYGICVRCLKRMLTALPRAAPRQLAQRRRQPKECNVD
jgi:hypothetical protein